MKYNWNMLYRKELYVVFLALIHLQDQGLLQFLSGCTVSPFPIYRSLFEPNFDVSLTTG